MLLVNTIPGFYQLSQSYSSITQPAFVERMLQWKEEHTPPQCTPTHAKRFLVIMNKLTDSFFADRTKRDAEKRNRLPSIIT